VEGPPIVLGPDVSQSLTLGGGVQSWVRMRGPRLGCSIQGELGFQARGHRGQHQCSGALMSDLRKNGGGGRRDGVRR